MVSIAASSSFSRADTLKTEVVEEGSEWGAMSCYERAIKFRLFVVVMPIMLESFRLLCVNAVCERV